MRALRIIMICLWAFMIVSYSGSMASSQELTFAKGCQLITSLYGPGFDPKYYGMCKAMRDMTNQPNAKMELLINQCVNAVVDEYSVQFLNGAQVPTEIKAKARSGCTGILNGRY